MSEMRIVSLVPSLTELVCELGLGPSLVGRTGFCIHPRDQLADVPKLGGTKKPMLDRIRALRPTHLILNREENDKAVYEAAAEFVPNIVVTFPITLDDNRDLIGRFGDIFDCKGAAERLLIGFDSARSRLLSLNFTPLRVLYLIWRNPWMTVTKDTFISHMLGTVALHTVSPGEANGEGLRYPQIPSEQVAELAPDIVLLSSEPYRFRERHIPMLAELWPDAAPPCLLIDGEMTSWYGPRAQQGLDYLLAFRQMIDSRLKDRHAD